MKGGFDISSLDEGKFYYSRHRRMWGVWRVEKILPSGVRMSDFVDDFLTREEASSFVRKMNNNNKK